MTNKEMGIRIRKQRELLGFTREKLAERLNVSPKFCSDIEAGAKGMSLETLCKLSKELMISTDYILFGKTHSDTDDELLYLINLCDREKAEYLKTIIRSFVQASCL